MNKIKGAYPCMRVCRRVSKGLSLWRHNGVARISPTPCLKLVPLQLGINELFRTQLFSLSVWVTFCENQDLGIVENKRG